MTDEQILGLAHRIASAYTHRSDPTQHSYGFVKHTLLDFAHKLIESLQPNTQEPCAWMNTAGKSTLLTTREPHEDYGTVVEHWFPLYTHASPQQTKEPRAITFGGPKARELMLNQLVHPAPQQPLTDEQIFGICENSNVPYKQPYFEVNRFTGVEEMRYNDSSIFSPLKFARAIEAAHGVKP